MDILLQPSWTWNAIGRRHFEGNAVRAVEQGFSYFRCSSVGESGVTDPYGTITQRLFTGSDPQQSTVSFTLPLIARHSTIYNIFGFLFDYFIFISALFIYITIFVPNFILQPITEAYNKLMRRLTNYFKWIGSFIASNSLVQRALSYF